MRRSSETIGTIAAALASAAAMVPKLSLERCTGILLNLKEIKADGTGF